VRRLFWTFPDGLPGAGLLLMRLGIGGAVLARCLTNWPAESWLPAALCVAEALSAAFLLIGLCTPIWAAAAAAVELWRAFSDPAVALVHVLLAAIAGALALLGPGAFSVDARLFGWQRINLPSKGSNDDSN
jgi:putative oxidoreductase